MTAFPIFEQKMPLCWALLEISGLRRVITPFDPPSLSKFHKWR